MTDDLSEVKLMTIKEFREGGFLQELNRQFLHPLGLALALHVDAETREPFLVEAGEVSQIGVFSIIDARDDPDGMVFGDLDSTLTLKILTLQADKSMERRQRLGFVVQPSGESRQT